MSDNQQAGDVVIIEVGTEILQPNASTFTVAIPRAEWDAMDAGIRERYLIEQASEAASETVNTWAKVVDNPTPEQIADAL